MATTPQANLHFADGCPDCGSRAVQLPPRLPEPGDDFDWQQRDYDSFRMAMLEELAARFPERRRWSPADMEVVLVEVLASVLDQHSDMLDRSFAEAFLETARNPSSVRRLLSLIGYDAQAETPARLPDAFPPGDETAPQRRRRLTAFAPWLDRWRADYPQVLAGFSASEQNRLAAFAADPQALADSELPLVQRFINRAPGFPERVRRQTLERYWLDHPQAMDAARAAGPRAIHVQKRMVTLEDHAQLLQTHPLVRRARASAAWSGSWTTLNIAVMLPADLSLDSPFSAARFDHPDYRQALIRDIAEFNRRNQLDDPDWSLDPAPRALLRPWLDARRMAGQEVWLQDAQPVGISIGLSLRVSARHYRSEIRRAVLAALGNSGGGFFESGRLRFGEDLHASDIIETVMAVEGVETVCLNRFKRLGRGNPNEADSGRILLSGLEVAVCDNNPQRPGRGLLDLRVHGGQTG